MIYNEYNAGYDEGYRIGMQKMREVGQARIEELAKAFEEAVYLLNPTDEDMQKKAGVYRVVAALEKLKETNAPEAERKWVGLTKKEIESISDRVKPDPLMTEEPTWHIRFAQALERKLKEKNAGSYS